MILILDGTTSIFFPLKMLGRRDWKIQVSLLDISPHHNPHLFSCPMPSSGQELHISQKTVSKAGLVAEQGQEAVLTPTASAVSLVPPHGIQMAQQPWIQQSYFLRQCPLQVFHVICLRGMVWVASLAFRTFFWGENPGITEYLESPT